MRWASGGEMPKEKDSGDQSGRGSGGLSGPILTGSVFRGARMGLGGALLVILMSVVFQKTIFKSRPGLDKQTISGFGSANRSTGGGEAHGAEFISSILDDAQKSWERLLRQEGIPYRHAKVAFFRDYTTSKCSARESATGPFYCPAEEKIYIDLGFFDELASRPEAHGEFSQAYVIAHEVGHHVQKLLGGESQFSRNLRTDAPGSNQLAVKFELQADCLAGIWGHSTQQRNNVDQADIAAGMDAVTAVSGGRPDRTAPGRVSPETFAYGSSADRLQWFRRGLDSGGISSCNTFGTE